MSATRPVTLEDVRDDDAGNLYPCHLLHHFDDALILFAAGFYGKQDAYWIHAGGVQYATCVDLRSEPLRVMEALYPSSWEFVAAEAFEYAATTDRVWDLVSLDPPTGAFERCANLLDLWCDLAGRAVVMGCGANQTIDPPAGWEQTDMRRRSAFRGGVYWAVLERV